MRCVGFICQTGSDHTELHDFVHSKKHALEGIYLSIGLDCVIFVSIFSTVTGDTLN